MEDSLVVEEVMLVKFLIGPFCHLSPSHAAPASRLFYQEEVKQPHFRDTQRLNIMNNLGPPEAPYHQVMLHIGPNTKKKKKFFC